MRILGFLISIICFTGSVSAQEYSIFGKVEGIPDGDVLLGYYYGNKQYVKDTVQSHHGFFHFKGDKELESGMYFILLPNQQYFQLIVDQTRNFSFETSTANMIGDMEVQGSKENELFYDYQKFTQSKGLEAEPIKNLLKTLDKNSKKYQKEQQKLQDLTNQVNAYKLRYMQDHPKTFFVKLLYAMEPISIPTAPILEDGTLDSTFQYIYYKNHFWDHFDLTDDRMIRTPIFHDKMEKFIVEYTPQVADSIIKYVDILIEKTRPSDALFKYVVNWSTHHYESSKIMGHDAVFVHLVFNYFVTRQTPWVDEVQLTNIIDKAMRISPNLIGTTAPYLKIPNDKGVEKDLHKVEAPFTILFFYDPDCGHCKKEVPLVKETLEKYKDKEVKVYAVCTEFDQDMWLDFIDEQGIDQWINVIDLDNISNFRGKYNIMGTPRLFVLDSKKKIIAKQIDAEALDSILENEFRKLENN